MREGFRSYGKHCLPRSASEGSVLVTIVCVSLILMLAGLTMVIMTRQAMHRVHRTVQIAQAQAVAEAGIAGMVAKLGTNYTYWQNNTLVASFLTNGTYYVVSQLQSNGNVLIVSDGLYGDASNRTVMELLGTIQTHNNDLLDLNGVVFSGVDARFETAAFTMNGNIYANAEVTSASGAQNGTINGNISAGGTVGNLNPTGAISNNAPTRVLPSFNFDSYRQMALTNGIYLEGNQSLSGALSTPPNGIMYVNGDLTIAGGTFTGTIVVNGNITINNLFTQTQISSNMPSLLSTGSIQLNNHQTYNGVIYARVNVTVQNHITINGGIISEGYTDIRNNVTINPGPCYPAWDPLNPEVPPEVIVGGWLK